MSSTNPASAAMPERARKGLQSVLQALQEPGKAGAIAVAMGTSDSTVSRIKTERLEEVLTFLAHCGFKVVPSDFTCVDRSAFEFLTKTHQRVIAVAPQLVWDVDQ